MSDRYKHIVTSELTYQVTKPLFLVSTVIIFLLAFNDITITSSTASGLIRIGEVHHNSPLVISRLLAILSILSIIVAPFIIAQALQKDFDHNIHGIFYSYPITDSEILWGRFGGAFISFLIIPLAAVAGVAFGNWTLADAYVGSFYLGAYLWPLLLIVLPGLLFSSLAIYLVTIKTRKNSTIYLSTIILFLLFFFIQAFLGDQLRYASEETMPTLKWLTLLDPFGMSALNLVSQGMTVTEKNEFTLIGNSFFLVHRFCWLLICIGLLAVVHRSFKRTFSLEKKSKKKSRETGQVFKSVRKLVQLPSVRINHSITSKLKSLARLSWLDFKYAVFNIGFILVTLLSLSSLHSNFIKNVENSEINPTTQYFINNGMDNVDMPILLLILFFTGVIVWRERDYRFDTIIFSYPLSNTFIFIQKLVSIALIVIFYFTIVFSFGVFAQIVIFGYDDISFQAYGHYLAGYSIFRFLVVAAVFSLLHVISPNKFIGYGLSVLGILFVLLSPFLGVETHLLRPGTLPEVAYSHLNGLNPVNTINFWYRIYWGFFIGFACTVGIMIWDRGEGLSLLKRISGADVKKKASAVIIATAFISIGGFIAMNSGTLQAGDTKLQTYLEYEKKYKKFERTEQPAITHVMLNVELYPSHRSGRIKGNYGLTNDSKKPIDAVHITLISADATELKQLAFSSEGTFKTKDSRVGYYLYSLNTPLQPGDTVSFSYELEFDENEYKDQNFNLDLVQNGMILSSFIGHITYFPQIGYKRELEVQNKEMRAEHGLNPKPSTLISLADSTQPKRMSRDMINYEAVISTEEDHTAISTGFLAEAWQEESRNYYRYQTRCPINGEFGIVSGRYKKYATNTGGLTVNIFYDKKHDYNLKSITEGIIESYRFNETFFENYGHPSINIVEVPGYGVVNGTAISKPTLILWNENGGFTADVSQMYIDRVYSTAAHEMAHQWWGHRLRPVSFTEGQQLMYETIAQYIRLVALEKKFDEPKIQRFLDEEKYYYTSGVTQSNEEEKPLFRTNQSHIIYNKGTLVMDSLRTLLGEEKFNNVLAGFYTEYALDNKPPVSIDLVDWFEKEAPDSVRKSVINLLTKPGVKH